MHACSPDATAHSSPPHLGTALPPFAMAAACLHCALQLHDCVTVSVRPCQRFEQLLVASRVPFALARVCGVCQCLWAS
jgi:hypothetical protein